jgi:hypothetical protein
VIQGINAFTLGMRSVNPKATVRLVWLSAWFDPPREPGPAMTLFNQGVEVDEHTGSTVMRAAQERGKLAIASFRHAPGRARRFTELANHFPSGATTTPPCPGRCGAATGKARCAMGRQ